MLKVCRAAHTYGSITSGFDDLCFTISISSYFSLVVAVSVLILLLTSCGGSGGASQPPPPSLSLTASPNAVSDDDRSNGYSLGCRHGIRRHRSYEPAKQLVDPGTTQRHGVSDLQCSRLYLQLR